ncbi:MAG: hypothetical protein L3K09_04000, partial [Thermoplasmata archaeon]|nr:hypothetical protein [Thermoplasmata archaeon]
MARRGPPGLSEMRSLAITLPQQFADGYRAGRELDAPLPSGRRHAVVAGMGGSAIASDLLRVLTDAETSLILETCRSPRLPKSLDASALAVLVSYSGDTWETLGAYEEARRRRSAMVAVSSGGELAARAIRDGLPHLMLPPGMPPRAAVGYVLGGLLGLFDPLFPESNEERVGRTVEASRLLQAKYVESNGPPAHAARRIGARLPHFIACSPLAPLALRWATQVEENAKRLATSGQYPEAFHNDVVGWDALQRTEARRHAAVFIDWGKPGAAVERA